MKNSKIILIAIAILILAGLAIIINKQGQESAEEIDATIEGDPIDSAMDFYDEWNALKNGGKNPYAEEIVNSAYLTDEMRNKIMAAQSDYEQNITDPVLCRTEEQSGLRSKLVSQTENSAQVLMVGPRRAADAIALVKLAGVDGMWKISDIDCNAGETGPELGEFTFEQNGYLLKQSVKPPLDPNNWYLVYESDGVMGFTAVLNFNDTSVCTGTDGSSTNCGDESFYEAMKVHVKGNMSEAGVDVVQVAITQ